MYSPLVTYELSVDIVTDVHMDVLTTAAGMFVTFEPSVDTVTDVQMDVLTTSAAVFVTYEPSVDIVTDFGNSAALNAAKHVIHARLHWRRLCRQRVVRLRCRVQQCCCYYCSSLSFL